VKFPIVISINCGAIEAEILSKVNSLSKTKNWRLELLLLYSSPVLQIIRTQNKNIWLEKVGRISHP